jgi:heme exporter protein D
MKEFFAMGGYAFFVWASYGIVAFVLIANVLAAIMKRKRIFKQLRELTEES